MNIVKEFLQWRRDRKAREQLMSSWCAPYELDASESTPERTVYAEYKIKTPVNMTDFEVISNLMDCYGPRSLPSGDCVITYDK